MPVQMAGGGNTLATPELLSRTAGNRALREKAQRLLKTACPWPIPPPLFSRTAPISKAPGSTGRSPTIAVPPVPDQLRRRGAGAIYGYCKIAGDGSV